jgi:hypothetical protein
MTKLTIALIAFAQAIAAADAAGGNYKVSGSCQSCAKIDGLAGKHNSELSPDKRVDIALELASQVREISLKGKPELEQRREVYFAINGTIQVLPDDHDSSTVVYLMDLRSQSPKQFDYVFWRFPISEQQKVHERMKAAKADNIRPKAQIPTPKAIE